MLAKELQLSSHLTEHLGHIRDMGKTDSQAKLLQVEATDNASSLTISSKAELKWPNRVYQQILC